MNHPVALGKSADTRAKKSIPVRVLHLINGEHYSGAERVQDLLAMSLPQFDFEVGFACLKSGKFPGERESQDSPLFELNMRSKVDFKAMRKLKKVIVENGYEILHAHTPRSLLVGSLVARKTGCPLIYHVHSPVGRDSTRSFANKLNQLVESWAANLVTHFVCVSESINQYMVELGHPKNKLTTVANGVAVRQHVPIRNAPNGEWTLGTTALFRPRKGTEVLLEALAKLNDQGKRVRLLAVGPFETAEYENKIKELARSLNVADLIEWTGYTSDVDAQFQRMDAFVLPSLFGEGLPMVILEAMAGGIPVVAAEVEGVAQAVRDGVDGLIFKPGNASHLAQRISELMSGKPAWQELRSSALERQRNMFSDTSMAEGVATVYERVLEER